MIYRYIKVTCCERCVYFEEEDYGGCATAFYCNLYRPRKMYHSYDKKTKFFNPRTTINKYCKLKKLYNDKKEKLINLCKDLALVKDKADGGIPTISNQGQALDGYSELYNYRNTIEEIKKVLKELEEG